MGTATKVLKTVFFSLALSVSSLSWASPSEAKQKLDLLKKELRFSKGAKKARLMKKIANLENYLLEQKVSESSAVRN